MKKNVIMIVNPISGDVEKSEMVQMAQAMAKQKQYGFTRYETTGDDDCAAIQKLYDELQPERILIAGGDGTVKMVAEALESKDVIFGIIPAGSANGLSVDLNLPETIEENVDVVFGDHFISIDMICINGKKSLHLSDLGLNAQLIKNYESSDTRGMLGYAMQAISTLQQQDPPFEATVITDSGEITCEARMIVIANSQKYGTGVTINPDGKMDDGKFEIIILKNLDLMVFSKIVTGNMPVEVEDVEILSTQKARITTSVPVNFQIDGEYIGTESKLDINILPGQMKIAIR